MESAYKGENNHKAKTFLHKGKSDSLILRWPSLEKQFQSDTSMQRMINRKYGGAPRQSTYSTYHDQCEGDDSSTSNSLNMISRTSSTASLSLGIAGPLIFPSSHAISSIANGCKARREEVESDEGRGEEDDSDEANSCAMMGKLKMVVPTSDAVFINIQRGEESEMALPSPPPISLKFVNVTYKVSIESKELALLQSMKKKVVQLMTMGKKKLAEEGGIISSSGGGASFSGKKGMKKRNEKRIVKGATGHVQAREVLALMGPSGSGKTTLLNLLSGRTPLNLHRHHQQPYTSDAADAQEQLNIGVITYNDMPYTKALKSRIGFVTQDDVLYPHLTVKETLMYAALLRLPKHLSKEERIERAMEVLYELGLERCQNTIIGGPFLRGISGGERKRVCMGQEILNNPSLLFLDEPTSGLDSTTALRIVHTLRRISQTGRTVVTTIHQPSSRIFHIFDKLILLSKGHMLYFGKASVVMDYFSSIGFSPQVAMNPADFLLDLASGNVVDMSLPKKLVDQSNGSTSIPHHYGENIASNINSTTTPSTTTPLAKIVRQYLSKAFEGQKKAIIEDPCIEKLRCEKHIMEAKHGWNLWSEQEWSTSWWSQFSVLYVRGLRERQHEYLSFLRILQVLASAFIIGCLWWHSDIQTERQLADQVGLLFFIATYWGFFPLFTALFTFPLERAILAKETACNMYRLSAYFMARTLGDIPLDFCLPLLFHTIVYFMAHLRPSASAFFLTLLIILLSTIASQGMGIAIGAVMMDLKKATTLASVVLLTFMLSGGFFVQSIPTFISWIRYISYNYHIFKLLVKVQYDDGQQIDCGTPIGCQKIVDTTIFHSMPLDGGAKEVLILLSMIVGYRLIAYVALRHMKVVA